MEIFPSLFWSCDSKIAFRPFEFESKNKINSIKTKDSSLKYSYVKDAFNTSSYDYFKTYGIIIWDMSIKWGLKTYNDIIYSSVIYGVCLSEAFPLLLWIFSKMSAPNS